MKMREWKLAILVVVLLSAMAGGAKADTIAVSVDNSYEYLANGPFTLGWQFTVKTPESLTALGFFTPNGQALAESAQLGLWNDSTKILLSTTTIGSGVSAPAGTNFIFSPVIPVALTPGTTYDIGAYFPDGTNPVQFPGYGDSLSVASAINYLNASYGPDGTFEAPSAAFGSPGFFGPNFTFATPEPASIALLVSGCFAFGGFGLYRRRGTTA